MFNGKMKAVTFSYDDGVAQDVRLIKLLDRYGLKCTFNINSGLLGKRIYLEREGVKVEHFKPEPGQLREIYENHEVAVHTLTHPTLPFVEDDKEVIRQVESDRLDLGALTGYEIRGMAYPGGGKNYDERVAELIKNNTGVKYARTTVATNSFSLPENPYMLHPTVHHTDYDILERLGDEFLALEPETPQLFYIWGHSYEFDIFDDWDRFERFLEKISGKDDIFYGTNSQCLL